MKRLVPLFLALAVTACDDGLAPTLDEGLPDVDAHVLELGEVLGEGGMGREAVMRRLGQGFRIVAAQRGVGSFGASWMGHS